MSIDGTTVVRRQLGRRLKELRLAAGRTEHDVREEKLASPTKLWRIEKGRVPVKVADARALCWFYRVDDATTDEIAALAAGTDEHGWWEEYGPAVPTWFRMYVRLEGVASRIRYYDGELVPGLLQTEDYARAVYRTGQHDGGDKAIERLVAIRMERQEALADRKPPLRIEAVLGAGALARQVGGPDVMATQIDRLRELDRLDHIEVRVVPWEAGAHAAMLGAFHILDFEDDEDPDVIYLESQVGGRYLEKPGQLTAYRRSFESVHAQAVPIEEYQP